MTLTRTLFATVALALSASAGGAFAGEANCDPFPFQANARITKAPAFMADTGSSAYPEPRGSSIQPSSLAQLEPAFGSEAPIQTPFSLPRGAGKGTVAYAQMQSLNRFATAHSERGRFLEVGATRPRS